MFRTNAMFSNAGAINFFECDWPAVSESTFSPYSFAYENQDERQ